MTVGSAGAARNETILSLGAATLQWTRWLDSLEEWVVRAAEAALADHRYVSAIDLFIGMRLLADVYARDWRRGRISYGTSPSNLNKISRSRTRRAASSFGVQGVLGRRRVGGVRSHGAATCLL